MRSVVAWGREWDWRDGNTLCLGWGGLYLDVHIHQYIQMYDFIICKLYTS